MAYAMAINFDEKTNSIGLENCSTEPVRLNNLTLEVRATNTWLKAIAQGNPELRLAGDQQALKISLRSAIATPLSNPSALGGQERIGVYTAFLADGTLFYYLTVVPENDAGAFQETFRDIGESIR